MKGVNIILNEPALEVEVQRERENTMQVKSVMNAFGNILEAQKQVTFYAIQI